MTVFRRLLISLIAVSLIACVSTYDKKAPSVNKTKASLAHVELGMAYLRKGDRERALSAFSEALEIDKKSAEAIHGMAMIHQMNEEHDLANQAFLKALKIRGSGSKTLIRFNYARYLFEQQKYTDAKVYFEQVSKDISFPNRSNALHLLGLCHLRTGKTDRALASFEHAMNLNPKNAGAALELADLKLQAKEYPQAKRYLDQYANGNKHSARSLLIGIKIERIFGNKDKEASYAIALKNMHPYSNEYLEYKKMQKK